MDAQVHPIGSPPYGVDFQKKLKELGEILSHGGFSKEIEGVREDFEFGRIFKRN